MVETKVYSCEHDIQERKATSQRPYHFIDSGLPNVYLVGVTYRVCEKCGKHSADIPAVKQLLNVIARAIVENESPLTGAEIRFLRKRVGKRASDFAKIIGVSAEQVSRWENGHNPPEHSADRLIRVFYCLSSADPELRLRIGRHIDSWLSQLLKEAEPPCIQAKLRKDTWKVSACAA